MKQFKSKAQKKEINILHSWPEFDRIPSDYSNSKLIMDDLSYAESNDKKFFSQFRDLDTYNAKAQDPKIKALYDLERTRAYEERLNKLETLYAIYMTNMGAWKEAKEMQRILAEDYKKYNKELDDFEKIHSVDSEKGGK